MKRHEDFRMSEEELFALPVSVPLVDAGRAFGMGRTKSYELAKSGKFPCKVLPVGNAYRVPKVYLLRALGYDVQPATLQAPVAAAS